MGTMVTVACDRVEEGVQDAAAGTGPPAPGDEPLPEPESPQQTPLLCLEQAEVRTASGRALLSSIDLTVPEGGLQTVVGPRGAGKSVLCRLLAGAAPPTAGRLLLFDRDTARLGPGERAALRRQLGVVAQPPHVLAHLSVLDNVLLPFIVRGEQDDQCRRDGVELLRWIGLGDSIGLPAGCLSSGERQSLAIARALVTRPALVIADEPFAPLDAAAARRIVRLLQELNRLGTTLVIALRDPRPELDLAPLRLSGGRLSGPREGEAL